MTFILCAALFVLALGIRLFGIGWGLKNDLHNESYHLDESLIFDFANKSHVFRGPIEREYYNYGTLYYAILRAGGQVASWVGPVKRPASLELSDALQTEKKWDDLNSYACEFILAGRVASAIAGAATVVLLFLILRRWTGITGALAGAAMVALSPAHVEHSRFQTVDVISTCFVALALLAALRMLRSDEEGPVHWRRESLIAGLLAGLAGGTRYTNVIVLTALFLVLLIRRPPKWGLHFLLGVVAAVAAFIAATPGTVTDTEYFLQNVRYQAEHAATGHGLVFAGTPPGYVMHLQLLAIGTTILAVAVGVIGLVFAAYRKQAWAWVLLAFFILYLGLIGGQEVKFLRYGFPLYIPVAAGFGYAISLVRAGTKSPYLALAAALLLLLGIESPQAGIRGAALFTKWMMGPDPRDEAGRYIKDLAARNPDLTVGFFGATPMFWSAAIVKDPNYLETLPPEQVNAIFNAMRAPKPVPLMSGIMPDYVTYSSYEVEDAARLAGRLDLSPTDLDEVVRTNARQELLYSKYTLDRVFGEDGPTVHDLEYIRPTIYVLKRKS